jgi:hypothetical protein
MKKWAFCLLALAAILVSVSTASLAAQRKVVIEYFVNTG